MMKIMIQICLEISYFELIAYLVIKCLDLKIISN